MSDTTIASASVKSAPATMSLARRLRGWAIVLVAAVLLSFGLRVFVVQSFYVPTGSMIPTLPVGDRILVDKLFFVRDSIQRGDIIVFGRVPADTDPTHPADLVKRVIGLPGETISSRGDTILINGRSIAEPWLPKLTGLCAESSFGIQPTHIAKGHYFVMGDCRGDSDDSRYWGTVPASDIVGKVFVSIWNSGHPTFHWF
jgi:signal peptidase I